MENQKLEKYLKMPVTRATISFGKTSTSLRMVHFVVGELLLEAPVALEPSKFVQNSIEGKEKNKKYKRKEILETCC